MQQWVALWFVTQPAQYLPHKITDQNTAVTLELILHWFNTWQSCCSHKSTPAMPRPRLSVCFACLHHIACTCPFHDTPVCVRARDGEWIT